MAEAFVALYKAELVQRRRFPSFEQAEHETLHWIGFYNNERLHEELGYVTPSEYEQQRPCGPPEPDQPAIRRSAGRARRTDHAR